METCCHREPDVREAISGIFDCPDPFRSMGLSRRPRAPGLLAMTGICHCFITPTA